MVTFPVAAPPPTIILVSPTVSPPSPKHSASSKTSEPSVNRVHHPQRFDPSFLTSVLLQALPLLKNPLIHRLYPALVHHAPPTTHTHTHTPTVSPNVSPTPNPMHHLSRPALVNAKIPALHHPLRPALVEVPLYRGQLIVLGRLHHQLFDSLQISI
jgi:hypothetical protein